MAYTCYKPPGSCKTCPHYRYDDDDGRYACFAKIDEESGKYSHSETHNLSIGDYTEVIAPEKIVIDKIDFFDDLEHDCWSLFESYANTLGIKLLKSSNSYNEDFSISKEIQETILGIFERAGITIEFPKEG